MRTFWLGVLRGAWITALILAALAMCGAALSVAWPPQP